MKLATTLDRAMLWNLATLFLAGCLFWSSTAAFLPVLPLYVQSVGGNEQQVGLVMGALALGVLLSRPRLGLMADRESRKQVMIIGLGVAAVAPLGYLFTQDILLLMTIRAFHGISIAAFSIGASSLVVDLAPPAQRGEILGYMSLVNPVGLAIGPALGGFIQHDYGYVAMFWTSVVLAIMGLGCTVLVWEPPLAEVKTTEETFTFWGLLQTRALAVPTVVMLVVGIVFGTVSTFVALLLKQEQIILNPGLFYTALAVTSFGTRLVVGKASDQYGRGLFMTASLVLYGVAMTTLWQAYDPWMFLLAGAIEGMASGMLFSVVLALTADRSRPGERGRVLGLCLSGFDLGIAVAGPVLGTVASGVGLRNMFAFSIVLTVLALVMFVCLNAKNVHASLRFALGLDKDPYALAEPPA